MVQHQIVQQIEIDETSKECNINSEIINSAALIGATLNKAI